MTDTNTPASVVEAMAMRLFMDNDAREIAGRHDEESYDFEQVRDYWEAIAKAALASQPTPNAKQPRDNEDRPDGAIHALTNGQQQADMDGVMVTVSRQALDETLAYLARIDAALATTTQPGLEVDRVFALEAADELEKNGKRQMSLIGAIPAIFSQPERQQNHISFHEAEAQRWFRLASAVRSCAGWNTALSQTDEQPDNELADELERLIERALAATTIGQEESRMESIGSCVRRNKDTILIALRNQPSVDDVIEQCAKVADEQEDALDDFCCRQRGADIAAAIRNLASGEAVREEAAKVKRLLDRAIVFIESVKRGGHWVGPSWNDKTDLLIEEARNLAGGDPAEK